MQVLAEGGNRQGEGEDIGDPMHCVSQIAERCCICMAEVKVGDVWGEHFSILLRGGLALEQLCFCRIC